MSDRLTSNPTHWYLELARGAFQGIYYDKPLEAVLAGDDAPALQQTMLALMSMTVVNSYLALESFANYQIYDIWSTLKRPSSRAEEFERLCGNIETFDQLKNNRALKNLGDRINIICRLLGFRKPCDADPALWNNFKSLTEKARHFLVHPFPEKDFFNKHMKQIAAEIKGGLYVQTASGIIGHLYKEAGLPAPDYLEKNTLFRFRGVEVL